MGYKGRLRLGAIDTRQDVFPLHIGFQWGHEAHTCKKFFFMPTFGAFVNKPLAQPFHPLQIRVDKGNLSGYTEDRNEGATGKRLAPYWITEVTAGLGRPGGYFFLLACMNRAIMPTIKIPVWIRSEYVTI